jgi:predicted  nucleic acid-binding Zn-ribbon protein
VNYFTPGLREIARKLSRQRHRLRILLARRELTRAETALGLLGWQQAEFDPQTQAEVDKINAYEREQSRLTNEGAGLAKELRELRVQREAARKVFEEKRRELEGQRSDTATDHPTIEKQLAELRKGEPTFERRVPDLDRELRNINRLYGDLITAANQTAQMKAEISRLRERTVTIANEKADLRNQHLRTVSEVRGLEARLERDRETIVALEREQRDLQAQFDASDGQFSSEIRAREREKARIEKEINTIETAKTNPYLQIGRVLADNDVAPMNQPGALDKVKRLRGRVVELDHLISLSFETSALQDRETVRLSMFLWGVITFIALLLILAAIPRY